MKKIITAVLLLCMLLCGCAVVPDATLPQESATNNATNSATPGNGTTQGSGVTPGNTTETTDTAEPSQTPTPDVNVPDVTPNHTVLPQVSDEPLPTVAPTVTQKPQITENKAVIRDFNTGSATDSVRSADWPALGLPIINPSLSVSSDHAYSGNSLQVTLPDEYAIAQNFFMTGNALETAFKSGLPYFRMYIVNDTNGTLGISIALNPNCGKEAIFSVDSAGLVDKNGNAVSFSVGDPSEAGKAAQINTAVIIPVGFEGWLYFDASKLAPFWGRDIITDITTVNELCIDVRPENHEGNSSYYIDDVCFTNMKHCAKVEQSGQNTDKNTIVVGPGAGSVDIYGMGNSTNLLVGIDQFGRTFDVQVGERSNKDVGMFFWLWNGYHRAHNQQNGNYDATKIIQQYGLNVLFKQNHSASPVNQFHFWGEPLWGYYDQRDEWVIRKQMELLANAGVDFIVFDTTNGWDYYDVYIRIARVISEMMKDGAKPPKIAFYTHSLSLMVINSVYNNFYKKNQYPETWYRMDGKPLIIGYTTVAQDAAEAASRGDKSYNPNQWALSSEILNFFHFRTPQWPGDKYNADGFPWIEWSYPQPMYNGGVMNVSVASHPNVPMSFSLTRGTKNWGRGYNVHTGKNVASDVDKGTFFQSQWDTVHSTNPNIVFVDGWNEWIAIKSEYMGEYMLCDAANKEYSRDIEMMKGGYNDAFYIQLIQNIRKYKGRSLNGSVISTQKTIDISGKISQWDNVNAVYKGTALNSIARNHASAGDPNFIYREAAARNNIQQVKITRDADNFYFLIECKGNITGSGANYMNLFIGTGKVSSKGWNSYEYVINRKINGNSSEIWKLDSSFNGTKVGDAQISVSGKYMQIKIPRSAIGMQNSNSLYFKVADNITNPSDIMDYYVSGKSFPIGRLSYQYLG